VVGGLIAHTLQRTSREASEIFLYDIAVPPKHQRNGVGRRLFDGRRQMAHAAGIEMVFVPAEGEDTHALDFDTALGGSRQKLLFSTLSPAEALKLATAQQLSEV
jgi:aminoglycoside 3-N-acetyltransferase I